MEPRLYMQPRYDTRICCFFWWSTVQLSWTQLIQHRSLVLSIRRTDGFSAQTTVTYLYPAEKHNNNTMRMVSWPLESV